MIKHINETKDVAKEMIVSIPILANINDESSILPTFKKEYTKKKDFYSEINNYIIKQINGYSLFYDGKENHINVLDRIFNHLKEKIYLGHPSMDGVGHINVYSKGCTQLGRMLTNFYHCPIDIPKDGKFNSIEGYWYWLKTQDDSLRRLSGALAKKTGKEILSKMESKGIKPIFLENFNDKIKDAITLKVLVNSQIKSSLENSTLPFKHYYFYGKIPNVKIYNLTDKYQWQMDHFNTIRNTLKEEKELTFLTFNNEVKEELINKKDDKSPILDNFSF